MDFALVIFRWFLEFLGALVRRFTSQMTNHRRLSGDHQARSNWGSPLAVVGGFGSACDGHKLWSKGRVMEIYGPENSGKTTLDLHLFAKAQKNGDFPMRLELPRSDDVSSAAFLVSEFPFNGMPEGLFVHCYGVVRFFGLALLSCDGFIFDLCCAGSEMPCLLLSSQVDFSVD